MQNGIIYSLSTVYLIIIVVKYKVCAFYKNKEKFFVCVTFRHVKIKGPLPPPIHPHPERVSL
jgi:hypothetical protein